MYKVVKRTYKKSINKAKFNAYDIFYVQMWTKERNKGMHKLTEIGAIKTRDPGHLSCIKKDEIKVLVK